MEKKKLVITGASNMADVARILLLSVSIWLVQSVRGANDVEIVEPRPKSVYAFEFDSANVTCVALSSSGTNETLNIRFMRRDDFFDLHELKEDKNVFFKSQIQQEGENKKLFRTMVIKNLTRKYDSSYGNQGGYECHAFAGNRSVDQFAFNVYAIEKSEVPKVTVTPHVQVLKNDEDLTLFCNLTNRGSDGTDLENMFWFKDGVLLNSIPIGESEKVTLELSLKIGSVGVKDGGIYSCLLGVKLRRVLEHNVSDDALIRIATWFPGKHAKTSMHNVEQKSFKGDNMSFECAAKGFPLEIEWKLKKKNEDTVQACINGTTDERYKIQRRTAHDPYVLTISDVQYSDRGFYYCCLPSNCSDNVKDNCQRFVLRVRDPLGALWPAIGILIEAIVLFAIIFFAGRREKKKEKHFKRN